MTSLYERLGGTKGITQIANDLVDLHLKNPRICARFAGRDIPSLKKAAAAFFITGAGGPSIYKGKDMLSAHKGMNIDHAEFMAVLDDALAALVKNGIGQREQEDARRYCARIGKSRRLKIRNKPNTALPPTAPSQRSVAAAELGAVRRKRREANARSSITRHTHQLRRPRPGRAGAPLHARLVWESQGL